LSLLFFDTETTGVPRNYKAPASDLNNWPRLVQIAWLLANDDGTEIESAEYIVKPDGFTIPADAARIHGITTEVALREGAEIRVVLEGILSSLSKVSQLVAHNIDFDEKILGAELLRAGLPNVVETKLRLCTMRSSTDFCRLPGAYGFKWPKLDELHRKLFNKPLAGAHRALVDVRACARCYFELKRLKIVA
jgi:DNA polymerase III epsilon subunit-like protein